ncbi:DNA helicase [Ralstonia solanacearum]|nr:DNA helicase [Ralstonia solanacearum]
MMNAPRRYNPAMNAPTDPQLESLKVPPHSIEAEQSVLGGLLLDNAAWDRIADFINEHDFYRYDHRLIFHNIGKLISQAKPADVITVYEQLQAAGKAEEVGGLAYLNALAQNTPSAANIRRYAEIVRDRGVLRQLVTIADEISAGAFNPQGRDVRQLLDEAESKVFAIAEEGARGQKGFLEIQPLLTQVVERIDELYHRDNQSDITGVPTGFVDLDRMTSGMQGGDLIIVAGRPSMGKTAFSLNIGEHVAVEQGLPVAVFSMEMAGTQLAMRMLGSVGRLDQHRLRTGRLLDEDWPRLTHAIQKMNDAQLFIDETPALNPMELRARSRRLARQCGQLGLIIIDYLQLMSGSGGGGENRATEISEISRSLKGLAKELNCPVIALSQLNRSLEQRPNKRPVMSDLRESGAIEQDADVILFIYRDQVYNPDSPDKGTAEIIIGKQRNGPIGTVRLTFLGEYTKFDNFTGGNAFFDNDT